MAQHKAGLAAIAAFNNPLLIEEVKEHAHFSKLFQLSLEFMETVRAGETSDGETYTPALIVGASPEELTT